MLSQDVKSLRNEIRIRSLLTAFALHAFLATITLGGSLVLLLLTGSITSWLCSRDIDEANSGTNRFKKSFPFRAYGESFGDFQHVFHYTQNIERQLIEAIERRVIETTPVTSMEPVEITDVDKDLKAPDKRTFIKTNAVSTGRDTDVTLVLNQESFGKMQSIQWRVLAGGYIDRDKRFNFISLSVLTFWFWIIPYVRADYDLLSRLRTIHTGDYNSMDVITKIRCLHDAVFNAMIDCMDSHGIDTSDLRAQRMQVMNINVSGGKVSMGNIVQGAKNRITAAATPARATA